MKKTIIVIWMFALFTAINTNAMLVNSKPLEAKEWQMVITSIPNEKSWYVPQDVKDKNGNLVWQTRSMPVDFVKEVKLEVPTWEPIKEQISNPWYIVENVYNKNGKVVWQTRSMPIKLEVWEWDSSENNPSNPWYIVKNVYDKNGNVVWQTRGMLVKEDNHWCDTDKGYIWSEFKKECVDPIKETPSKEELKQCKSYYDGCNTCFVTESWEIGGCTLMYCPTLKEPKCLEKREENKISDNDMNLYKHIKKTLDKKYLKLEQKFIKQIEAKTSKMSETAKRNYLESYADKINELTSKFLVQYPQDIKLPEKANNIYLTLELLEQEIRIRLIAGIED